MLIFCFRYILALSTHTVTAHRTFHWRHTVKVIQRWCNKSLLSIASVVLSDNVHKIGPRNQIALRLSVFLLLLSSLVVKVREFNSCGGRRDPVGFHFAMSQKSLFELLLMKVIAVPCWPNRPSSNLKWNAKDIFKMFTWNPHISAKKLKTSI